MLRIVLIAMGTGFAVFINFALYCCLRVASEADDNMERMMQSGEQLH